MWNEYANWEQAELSISWSKEEEVHEDDDDNDDDEFQASKR
jgi:hypothetical protein